MSDASTVSPMSRHPGLNWGPTDYESFTAPTGEPILASERLVTHRQNQANSTKAPRWNWRSELARLRLASPECGAVEQAESLRAPGMYPIPHARSFHLAVTNAARLDLAASSEAVR